MKKVDLSNAQTELGLASHFFETITIATTMLHLLPPLKTHLHREFQKKNFHNLGKMNLAVFELFLLTSIPKW